MQKQTSLRRKLLKYTSSSFLGWVYFIVFFYTRVRVGVRTRKKALQLAVFGLVVLCALGSSLLRPVATNAASTDNTINFQARLQSNTGAIVPDGTYNVEFKLYNALSGGSLEWTEDYTYNSGPGASDVRVQVVNGYMSVALGSITSFPGTINWDQGQFLTMNIGGTGASGSFPTMGDGEMSPRLQMTAVPYAFRAGQLALLTGSNTSTLGFATQTTANSLLLPNESGTLCSTGSVCSGYAPSTLGAGYIQNGSSLQSGANFNISGNGTAATSFTTPLLQSAAASALTITGNAASTWSTSAGNLTVQAAAASTTLALDAGTSGTGTVSLGNTNAATINVGANNLAHTIHIADGGSSTVQTVSIGSSFSSSALTLAAGTGNININPSGASNTGVIVKPTTNSTNAFQIQNASGATLLGVDTTNGALLLPNLITNSDFEASGTTGWTAKGSSVISQTTAQAWQGTNSLQVATTTAANDGAYYTYTFSPSTQYTLSLYVRSGTSPNDIVIGRQDVSGIDITCLTGQAITNFNWTRLSCTFTTGATITSSNIFIQKSGASAETLYVDGVQLTANNTPGGYTNGGTLQLNGVITSAVAIQPTVNSSTVFAVYNRGGTSQFNVDTAGGGVVTVGSGASSSAVTLQAGTGNINLNAAAIATNATTLSLLNSTVTTLNAFQAVTNFNIGAASGTLTIANPSVEIGGAIGTNNKSLASTNSNAATFRSGNVNGATSNSGTLTLQSGNSTTSGNTGDVTITTGNATSGTTGTLYIDNGTSTSGTPTINIGTTNARSINIGSTSAGTTTLQSAGGVAVSTLGTANTATYLCLNSTNVISSCSATATGAAFVQGGNSFGATATLGTTDANGLTLGTYNGTALQQRINITNTTAAGNNATLTFNGASVFKSTANSTTAFQIQNAGGSNLFNVDTATTLNLVTNGDFETGTSGWSVKGSSTIAQNSTNPWQGNNSLQVATTTAANDGAQYNYSFTNTQTYTLTFHAKTSSGTLNDINIGRQDNGSSDINCLTSQVVNTSWHTYTCTFTAGAQSGTPNFYIKKTGATAETFYVDGVQLQTGSTATAFSAGGAIQLNTVIESPVQLQASSNSQDAFIVQNSAGVNSIQVDTTNNKITIGNQSGSGSTDIQSGLGGVTIGSGVNSGTIQIGTANGASTQAINIGTNTNASAVSNVTIGSTKGGTLTLQGSGISETITGSSDTLLTSTNAATAFQVQNASSQNEFAVDTQNNQVLLGQANALNGKVVFNNSSNANTISLLSGATGSSYSLTLPTAAPSAGLCLQTSGSSSSQLIFSSCANQNASISQVQEWDAHGAATTTLADAPVNIGDVLVLTTQIPTGSDSVTGVSGGGVTTWTKVIANNGNGTVNRVEMWIGKVTTTGAGTITVSYASGPGTNEITATEFTASGVSINTTWGVDTSGSQLNASSNNVTYSSIQSSGPSEVYVGYGQTQNAGSAGSTSGFSYIVTGQNNVLTYATPTIAGNTYQSVANQAVAGQSNTVSALLTAFISSTAINNSTSLQQANFYVQAATSGSVAGVLQANSAGTGDILDLRNSSSTNVLSVGNTGNVLVQPSANSTTAFQIQNALGTSNLLVADTTNSRLGVGMAPTQAGFALEVGSNGIYTTGGATLGTDLVVRNNTFGQVKVGQDSSANSALQFGQSNTYDSEIYRVAAGKLAVRPYVGNNSIIAFQVQNAAFANLFNVDTLTTSNLITNGDFEADGSTGWTAKGGSTVAQDNTYQWQGNNDLSVATTTAANDGAKYAYTMSATTQYTLSFYAKVGASTITDFVAGRQDVSGTDVTCLTGQTLTTSWTRFTCTFTTGGTITSSNIFFQKSGASAETFYIDGVQLQAGASATSFNPGGALQLNGTVNSPAVFQNKSDSTTAFQIQNAAGSSNLLIADTTNTRIGIGAVPANSLLTIGTNTTTAAGGITFGTDTTLYRHGTGQLATDTALLTGGNVTANSASAAAFQVTLGAIGPSAQGGVQVGSDTNLYRTAAGSFEIQGSGGATNSALIIGGVTGQTQTNPYLAIFNNSGSFISQISTTGAFQGAYGSGTNSGTTAAQNLVLAGGQGTGTGVGGNINFQVAKAGSSGSSLNTLATVASISGINGSVLFQNAADSTTAFQIQNAAGAQLVNSDTTTNQLTVTGNLNLGQTSAPGAPTVAVNATAGNLNSTYYYAVSFVTASGETSYGTESAAVAPASQQVNLSNIPTGTNGLVTARKIYRTKAGAASGSGTYYLVTTLNNNTTTTYTDNTADASLTTLAPADNKTAVLQVGGSNAFNVGTKGQNTWVGLQAGSSNSSGTGNSGYGYSSLNVNTTGTNNTAVGVNSLGNNTTGSSNNAFGVGALQFNTTGVANEFFGSFAGFNNTTGPNNSGFGHNVLQNNTTGANNAALGYQALFNNTTGAANVALGYKAGLTSTSANANTTGFNNTFIGTLSGPGSTTQLQNATAIGTNAVVSQNDSLVLGCISGNNGCTTSTKVGIGTTTPENGLQITASPGTAQIPAQLRITDTTAYATGVGGGISLAGDSGTGVLGTNNDTTFALLKGYKENATQNNNAGGFAIYTRPSAGNPAQVATFGSTGAATFTNSTDSTNAFQIQNASGTSLLTGDTTNMRLNVGGDVNVGSNFGNRLFSDGFESGNLSFWANSGMTIDSSLAHNGKYSAKSLASNSAAYANALVQSSATLDMRMYTYITSFSTNTDMLYGNDIAGQSTGIYHNTSNQLCVWSDAVGATLGCSAATISIGSWHSIEFKIVAGTSTGTAQIWLDGTSILSLTAKNTGATNYNSINIGDSNGARTATINYDDISVDTTSAGLSASLSVSDSLHVSGTSSFGNSVLVQPATDNTTAFQVQNAGGTAVLTADTTNSIVTVRGINSSATLGAERMISTTNFSSNWTGTNWVFNATSATHTAGNTAAAVYSGFTPVSGATYQVTFTFSGASGNGTDAITPSIGGVSGQTIYSSGVTETQLITTSGTGSLSFTPTSSWNGTITSVSVMLLTGSNSILNAQDSTGANVLQVRGSNSNNNTFLGVSSGINNTTGNYNTALGVSTLQNNTAGYNNVALGANALQQNTTGNGNSAFGVNALLLNTTGVSNVGIGTNALKNNTTGYFNVGIGANALTTNTAGYSNTGIGLNALQSNTTGAVDTAIGNNALQNNTTGYGNLAVGNNALQSNTTGGGNVALGVQAGYTSASGNANTTGSNNIFIGYQSGPGTTTQLQNATAIGAGSVVSQNNSLVLGCISGTNGCTTSTQVGIGTATPSATLNVVGTALFASTTGNSTTAFQVQGSAGSSATLFNADTTNMQIKSGGSVDIGNNFGTRFADGFESGSLSQWAGTYNGAGSTIAIDSTHVHDGAYATKVNAANSSAAAYVSIPSSSTMFARAYVYVTSVGASGADLMDIDNTSSQVFGLALDGTTHNLKFFNGPAGNVFSDSGQSVSLNAWHMIEERVSTNSTTGTIQVWLDGSRVINLASQNTGSLNINSMEIGEPNSRTATYWVDDVTVDPNINASTAAASLNVQDSLHVGGLTSFGNSVVVNAAANSTTAFQIQNAAGTNIFNVDTTNSLVGTSATSTASTASQNFSLQTGNVSGATSNSGAVILQSGDSTTSGNTGNVTITTGNATSGTTGTLLIDNGTATSGIPTVNIGTTNARSIAIGNSTGATGITLQAGTNGVAITTQGTGTLAIGTNAVAQTIRIGNGTGATSLDVNCGTSNCNFGSNSTDHSTLIGSNTGVAATTIQGGSGGINLNAATVATNATTLSLFNTTATTLNAFGAVTNLNIGAASGSFTIANPTVEFASAIGTNNKGGSSNSSNAATFRSGNATGATSNTGGVTLQSGNSTTSGNTGDVTITTGNATSGTTGTLKIDNGTSTSGTPTINIGTTNARSINIGNATAATALTLQAGSTGGITLNANNVTTTGSITGGAINNSKPSESGAATYTVGAATAYNLSSSSAANNTTFATTFNITGLPAADGTFIFINATGAKSASSSSVSHDTVVQINGTTFATVTAFTSTGAVSVNRAFILARIAGSWTLVGEAPGSAIGNTSSTVNTADYAEWISYTGVKPQPGDVLTVGNSSVSVAQSATPYARGLMGVVSTSPYQVGGADDGHSVIIALTGRVPVKVNLENGPIAAGDLLTSSSTPGVAMKATKPGNIIGTALEAYDGTQAANTVNTQLHNGYGDPTDGQAGSQIQGNQSVSGNLNVSGDSAVGGNLSVAGLATTQGLSVSGAATLGSLTVAGSTSTQDLIVKGSANIANLTVTSSAAFQNDISVAGHIITAGGQPVGNILSAAGTSAIVNISGSDTAGTITVTTGATGLTAGDLAKVVFSKTYGAAPHIVLSPSNDAASSLHFFKGVTTATDFVLDSHDLPAANTTYQFDYFIAQ